MADDLKSGLPVAGYRPQSDAAIALVNEFKADEERLLRKIDALFHVKRDFLPTDLRAGSADSDVNCIMSRQAYDARWVHIAKSHFEQGFMALNRAVFQPARIQLPEDEA